MKTQRDPFEKLQTIQAGEPAGTWSSLPAGAGCREGEPPWAGHAAAAIAPSMDVESRWAGSFDLIDRRNRLQFDAEGSIGCWLAQLAVQRQVTRSGDIGTWDGSALSWKIGRHWRLAGGRIARQWGPGWDGSLILGTAARPIPNLSVEADSGPLPGQSTWSWLGQVQFIAFLGQLEADRKDFPRASLMGQRLVLRPHPSLELGASRVAQFGGEGRSNSLRTMWTSLLGRDNGAGGTSDTQPGNQLAGFDARWSLAPWVPGLAVYGQAIGEDEAGMLPAAYMRQVGVEWQVGRAMIFAEWVDSTADTQQRGAYNHHVYTDGYRAHGRPLGHWVDGNSRLVTIGGLHSGAFGGQALAVLRDGTLNQGGANPTWPNARVTSASAAWRSMPDGPIRGTVAIDHRRLSPLGPDEPAGAAHDTQIRVQVEWQFH